MNTFSNMNPKSENISFRVTNVLKEIFFWNEPLKAVKQFEQYNFVVFAEAKWKLCRM